MRILSIISVFFMVFTVGVLAEETLFLNRDSAVRMALSKNFQIEVESYSSKIADAGVLTQLGRFDPRFEISYFRTEESDRRRQISGSLVTRADEWSMGVAGTSAWGMDYDVGLRAFNQRGSTNNFADNFDSSAGATLSQPLLRGFGPAANLSDLRIARTDREISDWQYRQKIADVVTQIDFVYNELYFAIENLEVAKRSQALAGQLYEDNKRRAEIGVMSPLNITTARAEVAARKENVILAERQVRDNENFLKQLVTNQVERILSTRIRIEPPLSPAFSPIDVQEAVQEAFKKLPQYQQALLELRKKNILLAFRRNDVLPRLDLQASLNLLGLDSELTESVLNTLDGDSTVWSAGAVFSVPIPNREGRGSLQAAKLAEAQALVDLHRLEQAIFITIDNTVGQITTAQERIESTGEARVLAKESLDAAQERLRAGTGTTFEVLELQEKLASAEVAELRAQSDYRKAISEYYRQTGLTLEKNRIRIE